MVIGPRVRMAALRARAQADGIQPGKMFGLVQRRMRGWAGRGGGDNQLNPDAFLGRPDHHHSLRPDLREPHAGSGQTQTRRDAAERSGNRRGHAEPQRNAGYWFQHDSIVLFQGAGPALKNSDRSIVRNVQGIKETWNGSVYGEPLDVRFGTMDFGPATLWWNGMNIQGLYHAKQGKEVPHDKRYPESLEEMIVEFRLPPVTAPECGYYREGNQQQIRKYCIRH